MGFLGMAASGCGFLLIGLWQACTTLTSWPSPPSSPSLSPLPAGVMHNPPPLAHLAQLISIAALSFIHMISGLVASHRAEDLGDGIASAVPLERTAVAFVFFIFAISTLISENFTRFLPFPREMSNLLALFAFGEEFVLFYLQRPDAGLESRYYNLLIVPILGCVLAVASNIAFPRSILPPLSLAGSLVLQGTWLLQMAASFFASASMTSGCELHMRGDGDYIIQCGDGDSEAHDMHGHDHNSPLMRAKAVATLQFNCHMALLLVIMLSLYAFFRRNHHKMPGTHSLSYEMISTSEYYDSKANGDGEGASSLPPPPPYSAFSLELDDDSDDKEDHHHTAN